MRKFHDGLLQCVHGDVDFEIDLLNLVEIHDCAVRLEQKNTAVAAAASTPFELESPSELPIRALLIELTPKQSHLVIVAHHIAIDGQSWEILCHELSAAYRGEDMPPLRIQYADYCLWEAEQHQSEVFRAQLAYWRTRLGTDPPALELVTDRPQSTSCSGCGASLSRSLADLARPIERLAAQTAATPFAILLATYFIVLHRLTGRRDLIVGILSSGRSQDGTEPLIGMFVNTLAIRLELTHEMRFTELLTSTNHAIGEAFDHQDVPFEEVVRQVIHERDADRMPLVQTMLTMDAYASSGDQATALALDGLEVTEIEDLATTTSLFDFSVGCSLDAGDDLILEAEYSTDLFKASRIAEILDVFESILRASLADPLHRPLDDNSTCGEKVGSRSNTSEDTLSDTLSDTLPDTLTMSDTLSNRNDTQAPVEPRTTEEVRLCALFCEILGLPAVGIHDSFFALGGDSLLCFRLVASARRVGYYFSVSHVLEFQSVARLADFLLAAKSLERIGDAPAPASSAGPVTLTPIQRWFFSEQFMAPSHYNQSRMFELAPGIDSKIVRAALTALICHHDALRLSYSYDKAGATQMQHADGDADRFLRLVEVNCKDGPDAFSDRVEVAARAAQISLDIVRGPVIAAVLVVRPRPQPAWLYLVIHHLMVDEVSWGIIEDDLSLACAQLAAGEDVVLPAKTHSFAQWSDALARYASSARLQSELTFWRGAEESCFYFPGALALKDVKSSPMETAIDITIELDALAVVPGDVPIRDVIISALVWTLATTGRERQDDVCLLLEAHGREVAVVPGFDLSRTVGWFTAVFPVRFDLSSASSAEHAIEIVLNAMRAVPYNGIGYGLLKYPPRGTSRMSNRHASAVSFNYLGRAHESDSTETVPASRREAVKVADTGVPEAADWDPRNQSDDAMLDISCHLRGASLEMSWTFDPGRIDCQGLSDQIDAFEAHLRSILSSLQHGSGVARLSTSSCLSKRFTDAMAGIWDKHRQHDSFNGMALSLVFGGNVLFAGGHGFVDSDRQTPVDAHSTFSLGSAGKPFVSLLGAALADEGAVDFDEPLERLLARVTPPLPTVYGQMTLRQLFLMTAGIPLNLTVEEEVDDIFEACRCHILIDRVPGTDHLYSNFSYALAGYLLVLADDVANNVGVAPSFDALPHRFVQLLRDKITAPLEMCDAEPEGWRFLARERALLDTGHSRGAEGSAMMLPSGALRASASDVAAFLTAEYRRGIALSGCRVAESERVAQRFETTDSLGYDWAMGWYRDRTHDFLHITGEWADAVTGLKLDLVSGLGMFYGLSVRDSAHWQVLVMDMDLAFIELLQEARNAT